MQSFKPSVFFRQGENELSKNAFSGLICFWVLVGIAVAMACASIAKDWTFMVNWFGVIVVLLVGFFGVYINKTSNVPLVSFVGYMLVVVPLGLFSGPAVAHYTAASIVSVLFVTSVLVAALGVVGAVIPEDLSGFGSYLFGGLIVLLVGYFVVPLAAFFGLPIEKALTWLDWAGIALFSFYVVYDWNKAMRVPYTRDNAIDFALEIWLDWMNIFLRLLGQTGRRNDD